ALPDWLAARPYATRVALSPVFASPLVEEVEDRDEAASEHATTAGGDPLADPSSSSSPTTPLPALTPERCRKCGATQARGGGDLRRCLRCMVVKYCSVDCQKADWRVHKNECEEASGADA